MTDEQYIGKTFFGLEDVLANELTGLGAKNVSIHNRMVRFEGTQEILYKANLMSRFAIKFIKPILHFEIQKQEDLYEKAKAFQWDEILQLTDSFMIEPVIHSEIFTHSQYAGLKLKDAIADHFREKCGKRPNVSKESPSFIINLHIHNKQCNIALDSTGAPLFKRGYRIRTGEAPINEVLAAGLLALSGWDKKQTLIDPMCGSATFLIEAALMALEIPPNANRNRFAFENWSDFTPTIWEKVRENSKEARRTFCPRLIGSDIDSRVVRGARENIERAGLKDYITLRTGDIETIEAPIDKGMLIINPPYGERLDASKLKSLYKKIGDVLKQKFQGFEAWIISSNYGALKQVGLKHSRSHILFNGPLQCKFRQYELYAGSKK